MPYTESFQGKPQAIDAPTRTAMWSHRQTYGKAFPPIFLKYGRGQAGSIIVKVHRSEPEHLVTIVNMSLHCSLCQCIIIPNLQQKAGCHKYKPYTTSPPR